MVSCWSISSSSIYLTSFKMGRSILHRYLTSIWHWFPSLCNATSKYMDICISPSWFVGWINVISNLTFLFITTSTRHFLFMCMKVLPLLVSKVIRNIWYSFEILWTHLVLFVFYQTPHVLQLMCFVTIGSNSSSFIYPFQYFPFHNCIQSIFHI